MTNKQVSIGHIKIDSITMDGALAGIGALIESGQGGYIVTPNVDHIVTAEGNPEFRAAYGAASLSLADGQPVLWMAKLLGTPLPEKVSGSDLMEPLMSLAAKRDWRVFLFGAKSEVSGVAQVALCARHPGLTIVGRDSSFWRVGDPSDAFNSRIAVKVRAARADLVIVALGSPKQELWMFRHRHALGTAVCVGLGASLDFASGTLTRSPQWMSRAGLEWFYRLSQEPRRLAHRYLVRDMKIIPIFMRTAAMKLASVLKIVSIRDLSSPELRLLRQSEIESGTDLPKRATLVGAGR